MSMCIGKFEVRRVLGRGAQSCVYLAHDPDLQRDVAIKRLTRPSAGAPFQLPQLEARAVSRLRHPNIVPIFEWGQQDGQAHLVFEYVEGRTLEQVLASEGPLPATRAVPMMIGILGALEQAHASGVIHRDLKPSNILLDESGQARVMDFGIATGATADGQPLQGTAAYMAPEYIAGGDVTPRYDVFAAGLVLFEMLFGRRAVGGETAIQAMHQIANMPLVFPKESHTLVDARLHDVIAKATAKDPDLRYNGARQMRDALEAWLLPPAGDAKAGSAQPSTLEFLLRRLKLKTDFPAMSSAIEAVQRLAAVDRTQVAKLSNFILKDFAFTNKILRLVNSAAYPNHSGDRIRTVSRAIVMLGFDAVRSVAISLMLFEHLQDRRHAQSLRDEYLRANLCGLLARDLGARVLPARSEELFICALFHDLGRLLTHYYLRDEAEAIERLVATEACTADAAALRVLGISWEDLGIGVARSWGFPETIVGAMRRLRDARPPKPASPDDHLRTISVLAAEVRGVIERTSGTERTAALAQVAKRFSGAVPFAERDIAEAVQTASQGLVELAATVGIDWRKTSMAKALGDESQRAGNAAAASGGAIASGDSSDVQPDISAPAADDSEEALAAGIKEVSQALVDDLPLADVLRIVAETIYRAIGARRVFLCLREASQPRLRARVGFGADADDLARHFSVVLGGGDLFDRILSKDAGVLIRDATEPRVRACLPAWFVESFAAPSFLVLPLKTRGTATGLIYADHERSGGLRVSEAALAQLHTLRNQMLLAVRGDRR